jgi:hypothetical protein
MFLTSPLSHESARPHTRNWPMLYNRAQIKGHKTGECGILLVGGCGHACTTAAIALEHV